MTTSSVAINWPSPTGLMGEKVKDTNNLIGNAARFTWDKITDISMQELDPIKTSSSITTPPKCGKWN